MSFIISETDFNILHNAICDLAKSSDPKVEESVKKIRSALKSVYKQEREMFDLKHNYYSKIQTANNFESIWSIYEVDSLEADHPFREAKEVRYHGLSKEIEGPTWLDLYRVADSLVLESEDLHHVFIENFRPTKNGNVLVLQTGS